MPFDADGSESGNHRDGWLHVDEATADGFVCCFVQSYPSEVASTLGKAETMFEAIWRSQTEQGLTLHGPFADGEEWDLIKWLFRHVGQTGIDKFTQLPIVSY